MLDELFMQVIDMTRSASVVILAVLLVRLLLKKVPKVYSYALWAVVLFRLLCPLSFEAPVSVMPKIEPVSEHYSLADEPISFAGASEAASRALGDALNGGLDIQQIRTTDVDTDGNVTYARSYWWEVWILFGKYVWLAGIAGMALYSVVSYLRLKSRLREAIPLECNIYLADRIESPFVMGLFRPKIYLQSSLSEAERNYITAHEKHHIRRLDHMVKLIAFFALCVHWFNPLVWLAFVLSGKDMEMSCDEAVIKKLGENIRADYSASLLSLATGRRIIAGTPLAFGEGNTGGRIRNLRKWKKPALWISVIAVIVAIVVGVVLMTDPADTEQQAQPSIVTDPTTAPVEPSAGTVYVSNQCLYMNPLSSYGAFGGDSGYRYHILEDSFIIEKRDEGITITTGYEVIEGGQILSASVGWNWIPVSEAGKELDALFENSLFYIGEPLKQDVLYQSISENYFLIQQDGALLIYEVFNLNKIGRQIWSAYSLVPESDMGSAQWEFDPASSADLPLFRFEFDMDCTDINAVCTQSDVNTYNELKDIYTTPQLKDGNTLYWSPVNKYGEIVTVADIGFTVSNGDQNAVHGRIYITSEQSGSTYLYSATIVGTGLHMKQSPDGTGAVITLTSEE